MKSKICRKCKVEKPINEFSIDRASKDGLQCYCKNCKNIKSKEHYKDNIDYHKQRKKQYYQNNIDYRKQYYKDNINYYRQYHRNYRNKLRQTPRGNLNERIHRIIRYALNGQQNSPTLIKLIGYTPQEIRQHFESLFSDGMTWETYGRWQIDHIKPICSFDYDSSNDPEFQECWALRNLQPLWREDNIKKGKNIPEEAIF